jgi:hypothetical protein
MNRYQISSPRKAIAIASVALTALTIGLTVIVPAKVPSDPRDVRTMAAITVTAPAPADRLRVDVVGTHDPELAATQVPAILPKHRQDG